MKNRFDRQLDILNERLIELGHLCELAIEKTTEAILKNDVDKAKEVIAADREIDDLEKEVEQMCLSLILQNQPVARDLRQISAALKMITDMERIGDQAADISEIVLSAHISCKDDHIHHMLSDMAAKTAVMVKDSVTAYIEHDLALARKVMTADDEIDEMFMTIRKAMIPHIVAGEEDNAFDLIMVAKYLERIGDHATNIGEWVEFSITGNHLSGN